MPETTPSQPVTKLTDLLAQYEDALNAGNKQKQTEVVKQINAQLNESTPAEVMHPFLEELLKEILAGQTGEVPNWKIKLTNLINVGVYRAFFLWVRAIIEDNDYYDDEQERCFYSYDNYLHYSDSKYTKTLPPLVAQILLPYIVRLLEKVVLQHPKSYLLLGIHYKKQNKISDAIVAFEAAVKGDHTALAYQYLGDIYASNAEAGKAFINYMLAIVYRNIEGFYSYPRREFYEISKLVKLAETNFPNPAASLNDNNNAVIFLFGIVVNFFIENVKKQNNGNEDKEKELAEQKTSLLKLLNKFDNSFKPAYKAKLICYGLDQGSNKFTSLQFNKTEDYLTKLLEMIRENPKNFMAKFLFAKHACGLNDKDAKKEMGLIFLYELTIAGRSQVLPSYLQTRFNWVQNQLTPLWEKYKPGISLGFGINFYKNIFDILMGLKTRTKINFSELELDINIIVGDISTNKNLFSNSQRECLLHSLNKKTWGETPGANDFYSVGDATKRETLGNTAIIDSSSTKSTNVDSSQQQPGGSTQPQPTNSVLSAKPDTVGFWSTEISQPSAPSFPDATQSHIAQLEQQIHILIQQLGNQAGKSAPENQPSHQILKELEEVKRIVGEEKTRLQSENKVLIQTVNGQSERISNLLQRLQQLEHKVQQVTDENHRLHGLIDDQVDDHGKMALQQ